MDGRRMAVVVSRMGPGSVFAGQITSA